MLKSVHSPVIASPRYSSGMTLLELIVAIAVVSLLMGTVVFGFSQWEESLQSRSLARQLASAMRQSRTLAVATNRESRVKFLAEGESSGEGPVFWLQQGNLSRESTVWNDFTADRIEFPRQISMGFTSSCQSSSTPRYISFNPDGSSNVLYVCILADDGTPSPQRTFAVGVSHASTGRVLIQKWNEATLRFE